MRRRWNKVLAYTLIITMWASMINIPINARENTDSAIEIKNEVGVENTEVTEIINHILLTHRLKKQYREHYNDKKTT